MDQNNELRHVSKSDGEPSLRLYDPELAEEQVVPRITNKHPHANQHLRYATEDDIDAIPDDEDHRKQKLEAQAFFKKISGMSAMAAMEWYARSLGNGPMTYERERVAPLALMIPQLSPEVRMLICSPFPGNVTLEKDKVRALKRMNREEQREKLHEERLKAPKKIKSLPVVAPAPNASEHAPSTIWERVRSALASLFRKK